MIELSNERIEQILHEETTKKEDLTTILRAVYARYMRLYEKYFADLDALNDDKIAELRNYHEETISLVKYYYVDIPMDTCESITEFEEKYSDELLGPDWRRYLHDAYKDFTEDSGNEKGGEAKMKAEFAKDSLKGIYEAMDYVFRDGLGTGSQSAKSVLDGFSELFCGEEK